MIEDEHLNGLLAEYGYSPLHFYFMSPTGDDATGEIDNIFKPFKSWEGIHTKIVPGDAVIYRAGTHTDQINCSYPSIHGTEENPVFIIAYPGENPVIDRISEAIKIMNSSHMVVHGMDFRNTETKLGRGILITESNNLAIRNVKSGYSTNGLFAMQDLHDILIEGCVFHNTDFAGTHGVYIGARELPNSNITFNNNLIYNGGMHGFQHNGRITNLVMENNIIHSCNMAAISLVMGVCDSTFRNNLCYNNNQGVVIYNYVSTAADSGILPYDQTNNKIINNTFWTGKYRHATGNMNVEGPEYFPSVHFNDDIRDPYTYEPQLDLKRSFDNNIFRNNIFVTCAGPVFRYDQQDYLDATIIENNVLYRYGDYRYPGPECTLNYGGGYYDNYDFDYFQAFSELIKDNLYGWPGFKDVSLDYATTPDMFDFRLLVDSIAINHGIEIDSPINDLLDMVRDTQPDSGCYEYADISGDITGDNAVNLQDYSGFLKTLGTKQDDADYNKDADYNNDGSITYSDFQTWYGFFIMG